jgi:phosphopantothenoylcysteine decarboxylase/phosphopantothenate--cysteine ligase
MDEDMWLHASTKFNLKKIQSFGNEVIPVGSGELASGLIGEGRMAEPEVIVAWLTDFLIGDSSLKGKRAMVTAGPTYEQIDPVRFIGNYSSGKMGIAIARELKRRGAEVSLIIGPCALETPELFSIIHVKTAAEMFEACNDIFANMDIAVMGAAVADYTPIITAKEKIKKTDADLLIQLTKTKDILKHLGTVKKDNQLLIGFALETNNEEAYARKKLADKNADMIVLNSLNDKDAGFGLDTNKITIFDKSGRELHFEAKSKDAVARDIVNAIIQL